MCYKPIKLTNSLLNQVFLPNLYHLFYTIAVLTDDCLMDIDGVLLQKSGRWMQGHLPCAAVAGSGQDQIGQADRPVYSRGKYIL